MTKYFTTGTPLASLEQMMMSVPRFAPRYNGGVILCHFHYRPQDVECRLCTEYQKRRCAANACPWLLERLEAGVATYGELVSNCFHESDYPPLKRRVEAVTSTKTHLTYKDREHRQRFEQWHRSNASRYEKHMKDRWLAALFLLSSDEKLWSYTWAAITWNCIDFSKVTLRDIDPQSYAVYQAAKSIFTGKTKITAAELADEELISDDTLRLIIDAVLLARYGGAGLATVWEGAPC